MDVFVRCAFNDPERLFTYNLAMLVSALCCGRYACANARAQIRACTKEWNRAPLGFYSDRQMHAGSITCGNVIRGYTDQGVWGSACMFRQPWIDSEGIRHVCKCICIYTYVSYR